jgi:hypothetical protein
MKLRLLASFLFALATPALAQGPVQPGPQHKQLAAQAGTWDAVIEMVGEDGKPVATKGVSHLRVGPGGFWLLDDFEGVVMGAPFQGHGTTGYDPQKGKYVGTWIDSWSPSMMLIEGSYDKTGKVLTMVGIAPGPDGKPVEHTMVTTDKDDGSRVFEMYVPGPDGKPFKAMTITYTRQPAKK